MSSFSLASPEIKLFLRGKRITMTDDFNNATLSHTCSEANDELYLKMEDSSQRQTHMSLGNNLVTASHSRGKRTTCWQDRRAYMCTFCIFSNKKSFPVRWCLPTAQSEMTVRVGVHGQPIRTGTDQPSSDQRQGSFRENLGNQGIMAAQRHRDETGSRVCASISRISREGAKGRVRATESR